MSDRDMEENRSHPESLRRRTFESFKIKSNRDGSGECCEIESSESKELSTRSQILKLVIRYVGVDVMFVRLADLR